jgi:hypothetical protein
MAKMGRPKKEIDIKIFEGLCRVHCTEKEICSIVDCCEDTLNAWCKEHYQDDEGNPLTFSDTYKKLSAKGNASLRRSQFKLAEKNATMAIWLGKQYLNQRDSVDEVVVGIASAEDGLSRSLRELSEGLESDSV